MELDKKGFLCYNKASVQDSGKSGRGQMEKAIKEVDKQTVVHIYLDDWEKLEKERG